MSQLFVLSWIIKDLEWVKGDSIVEWIIYTWCCNNSYHMYLIRPTGVTTLWQNPRQIFRVYHLKFSLCLSVTQRQVEQIISYNNNQYQYNHPSFWPELQTITAVRGWGKRHIYLTLCYKHSFSSLASITTTSPKQINPC